MLELAAGKQVFGDTLAINIRLAAVPMHCVAVSVVTQAELLYDVAKRGHPQGVRVAGGLTLDDWTS